MDVDVTHLTFRVTSHSSERPLHDQLEANTLFEELIDQLCNANNNSSYKDSIILEKTSKLPSGDRIVYFFEISLSSCDRKTCILPLLRIWNSLIGRSVRNTDRHAPSISMSCRNAFVNILGSSHMLLPKSLMFGNFSSLGTYTFHWEIANLQLIAEFFHDEKLLFVKFFNEEKLSPAARKNKKNNGDRATKERRQYTLKLPYCNIRKIVVESLADDHRLNNDPKYNPSTYLHFITSCPVQIFRRSAEPRRADAPDLGVGKRATSIHRGVEQGEEPDGGVLADSPVFSLEMNRLSTHTLYSLLSRIYHRNNYVQMEFVRKFRHDPFILAKKYDMSPDHYIDPNGVLAECSLRYYDRFDTETKWKMFSVLYLLYALFNRGCVVKDQLLRDINRLTIFIERVLLEYHNDEKKCTYALESVLAKLDDNANFVVVDREFFRLMSGGHLDVRKLLEEEELRSGYLKCRRIIVTPTRHIYCPPETIMGNRVLRNQAKKNPNNIIRISFREDDLQLLRANQAGEGIINDRVHRILKQGLMICDSFRFFWLGNSPSQLRDQGCYMMFTANQDPEEIDRIREEYGDFEMEETPSKSMARWGQCFTQSVPSNTELKRSEYEYDAYDFIGGSNKHRDEYIFSDGVGRISVEMVQKIAANLKLGKHVEPSCIQFRFRGLKGVLCKDPVLDKQIHFYKTLLTDRKQKFEDELQKKRAVVLPHHHVVFRCSQNKFCAPDDTNIEIVKVSTPSPCSLNRPWISILDQVSEMQSPECHERMCNRIGELLDRHVTQSALALVDERRCRERLKEMPHRLDIDYLSQFPNEFPLMHLTTEPFFRSLLKVAVISSLNRELSKMQIKLETSMARQMLGVVDETGLLQYGQIFAQYSLQCTTRSRIPGTGSAKKILNQRVLVTKHPCISAGDVRVFDAVDIPELHHLVDVIVFPRHGPRPHPDEMAGSDLDGDEYSIVWDPNLLLDRNEKPMDFSNEKKKKTVFAKSGTMTDLMTNFFVRYVKEDAVGSISIAHLINSDRFGINHRVCQSIALKHSQAVDFSKTGIAPYTLSRHWNRQRAPGGLERDAVFVPPERPKLSSDFMERDHEPGYLSTRLVGRISREVRSIIEVMESTDQSDALPPILLDPHIDVTDWEEYRETAEMAYEQYTEELGYIMDSYGVGSEAELISGCFLDLRNKQAMREKDEQSGFTTASTIEYKVTLVWTEFRKQFFEEEESGPYEHWTEFPEKYSSDEDNPLFRYCRHPTEEMKKKAVAYYRVCYEKASSAVPGEPRFLSLPWLVWDVLRCVKLKRLNEQMETILDTLMRNPLPESLASRAKEVRDNYTDTEVLKRLKELEGVEKYCTVYEELSPLIVALCEWGKQRQLFTKNGRFRVEHLALLLIKYATGTFGKKVTIERLSDDVIFNNAPLPEREIIKDPGNLLFNFLQFMGSRPFRRLSELTFGDLGYESCLFDGEWMPVHEAARETYLLMVFSGDFGEKFIPSKNLDVTMQSIVKKEISFSIELPLDFDKDNVAHKLRELFEINCVVRKVRRNATSSLVRITALGPSRTLRRLRYFLMLPASDLPINIALTKFIEEAICVCTLGYILEATPEDIDEQIGAFEDRV